MTTDYQTFCNINTTKEQRREWDIGDIYANEAQCLLCKDIIRSKNRHDFVWCKCENLAVDGGSWYAKRSFYEQNSYKDMIIMFSDVNSSERKERHG